MARRNNNQCLFTDFSKGLYLLDTPRGYGDQLASLAITGGRNIWSEKGALVPQYGYDLKAIIPDGEKVLMISEDDQSSTSVFIVTQDIATNKGNVYLYTASQGLKKYKTQIPSITTPLISARTGNNVIVNTAGVNYEFGAYYPESIEEVIEDGLPISTYATYYEITIDKESQDYYWRGKEIALKQDAKIIPVKIVNMLDTITAEDKEVTAQDILDEILDKVSMKFEGSFEITDVNTETYSNLFVSSEDGMDFKVGYGSYGSNTGEKYFGFGLKGLNDDKSEFSYVCKIKNLTPEIAKYSYKLEITSTEAHIEFFKGDTFVDSAIIPLVDTIAKWLATYPDKKVDNEQTKVYKNNILFSGEYKDSIRLRLTTLQGTSHQTITGNVSLIEKTINTLTFQYIPEEETESNPKRTIEPKVMGFCANRLCISDVGGIIYYSGVGVVDNFEQSLGAGYFEGFSDDNSECLALEDYYNGVLITKQNGLYFLAFGEDSTESVTTSAAIGISIKKIAQIGQEYAKDHVIVDKQIYAYDSNSSSILIAAAVNVFGSLVAGKQLVTAEELNAQGFGIPETKRQLVYNAEANVLILYYGEQLKKGIVYVPIAKSIFPREMDITVEDFQGFNQGVIGVSEDGKVFQDFKKGTIVEGLSSIVNFEPISLRDNKIICASLLEISELNGIEYDLTTTNTQTSLQHIKPTITTSSNNISTPPMLYSDKKANLSFESYSMQRKWADKISNCTRIYAPMSGRYGINLSLEFPKAEAFCLAAISIPDFSKGD